MSLTQHQCNEFWEIADRDHNDELSIDEMHAALKRYKPDISDCQTAGMFCGVDRDQNSKVSKTEFMKEMASKQSRSSQLTEMFRKCDKNGNGELPRGEVMQLISEYYKNEQNVNCIIGKFLQYSDKNGDGIITREEFMNFFG